MTNTHSSSNHILFENHYILQELDNTKYLESFILDIGSKIYIS